MMVGLPEDWAASRSLETSAVDVGKLPRQLRLALQQVDWEG
jgi:hypothetical protein